MIGDAHAAALVHTAFEYGAIGLGVALYRRARLGAGLPALTAPGSFAIMAGLLLGAAIGNKAVFLVERPDVWHALLAGTPAWPGQSLVGGLLGGLLGVEAAKAATGQTASTGDAMVLPIAAGIVLGRVGCLLAGLHDDTFGTPTALPWGLDLGDGVRRHPTQVYEMLFVAALAALLHRHRDALARANGLRFKLFLAGYLAWRLAVDGLKPVPAAYAGGLSGIQWVCIAGLAAYAPFVARAWRRAFATMPASSPAT